jgi:hypothetical protein
MTNSVRKISPAQERITKAVMRWYSKYNVRAYRLTGGRIGGTFPGGAPVCLITMLGKKAGVWQV